MSGESDKAKQDTPVPTEDNPFRDVAYIAKITCFKEATVRDWLLEGKLKGYRLRGEWRVLHSDFVEFLRERYGE